MLQEALEGLGDIIRRSLSPQKIELGTKKLIGSVVNGEIQQFAVDEPASLHKVLTLESFARAFNTYKSDHASKRSVWVSSDRIRGKLNESDRFNEDRVVMEVQFSHLFNAINALPNVGRNSPASPTLPLIRYFELDLYPSQITPENFLDALKSLRMERSDATEVGHDKNADKISKSVAAKCSSAIDVPGEIALEFEPYPCLHGELEVISQVDCKVLVDSLAGTVTVRPLPGSVEEAQRGAMLALVEKLKGLLPDDADRVFCGTSGNSRE